jgi:hypothetical protein
MPLFPAVVVDADAPPGQQLRGRCHGHGQGEGSTHIKPVVSRLAMPLHATPHLEAKRKPE